MIDKLKDFYIIFKNSRHEFYKEKHEAWELIKKVEYIGGYNVMILEKSKEFLNSLNDDLASWTIYVDDFKTLNTYNKTIDYICILKKVISLCCNVNNSMSKNFKQRNFKGVKEEYVKFLRDFRDYEKKYNMSFI